MYTFFFLVGYKVLNTSFFSGMFFGFVLLLFAVKTVNTEGNFEGHAGGV